MGHRSMELTDHQKGLTMMRSKDLWECILGETQLSLQDLRKCEGHLSGALRQCGKVGISWKRIVYEA